MNETAKVVMVPVDIEIEELMDRVANKFNMSPRRLKCMFRDEDGQMMDLSDQDELEMLIELAKEDAKLNHHEFGRAEVPIPTNLIPEPLNSPNHLLCHGMCIAKG